MELINVNDAIASYTKLRDAYIKKASQENPDETSHPTGDAPDGTQEPVAGERSKENTSDVNDAIAQSVQKADTPPASEDNTDSVVYHGADVLENPQGVPSSTDTPKDPGTESELDVSTEKSAAAEVARINALYKEKGSAAVAELTKQAMADLESALKPAAPAPAPQKKQAAAAGFAAAGNDLDSLFANDENYNLTKQAAASAEARGRELAEGYIPFFFDMMKKKAMEEAGMDPEMMGEMGGEGMGGDEDLAAMMAMAGGGEGMDEGVIPGAEGEMGGEGDPMGGGEVEGDPMGGMGGEMGGEGGDVDPQELVAVISDALDQLGISPEELVELEGDTADAEMGGEAPEEVKEAAMRKAAATAQLVVGYREMQRRAPGQIKKAAANRQQQVNMTIQAIVKKAAFVRQVSEAITARTVAKNKK